MRQMICGCAIGLSLAMTATCATAQGDVNDRIDALQRSIDSMNTELQTLKKQAAESVDTAMSREPSKKRDTVTTSYDGGLKFSDSEHKWSAVVNGRVQVDLRTFHPDDWEADTFSLRRARLGIKMSFLDDYSVRVEGEYSGSSVSLTYGYFGINYWPAAQLWAGQFKRMFGLDRSSSTNFTDFMERSLADSLLQGTYDRGVMAFGAPAKGFNYWLAATNGTGTSDKSSASAQQAEVDGFEWSLRAVADAAKWVELQGAVIHFGGSYDRGELGNNPTTPSVSAASARTEARGVTFFTPDVFSGGNVDRTRTGAEVALAKGPVKLAGEWIRANYQGTSAGSVDYSRDIDSYHADLMWLVTGEDYAAAYKNGVFGRIKPNSPYQHGHGGTGALELGVRYSHFDASDFSASNAPGTGTISATTDAAKADAVTVGAKWIPVANVRILLEYIETEFGNPIVVNGVQGDVERALNMRGQIDF